MVPTGSDPVVDELAFADDLRSHPQEARLEKSLKRRLAGLPNCMQEDTDGADPVGQIRARAPRLATHIRRSLTRHLADPPRPPQRSSIQE